jgi:hypothetical protein
MTNTAMDDLFICWETSPYPSIKMTTFFPVYAQLFGHLRGKACTFVETGILDGGSLFMWKKWLGDQARVIGIDLNPQALKWQDFGFEIHIGDQGDPEFWRRILPAIGHIDAFLDDGGHQSFQQIVTTQELIAHTQKPSVVAIEDTYTSLMKDFSSHGQNSFLEYAKGVSDCVVGRSHGLYPDRFPPGINMDSIQQFKDVFAVNFYNGIVAFQIDPKACDKPQIIRNQNVRKAVDFRYHGKDSATVDWPSVLQKQTVTVEGGK